MRAFAWLCVVVGVLLAAAVWTWADITFQAFMNSSDYTVWLQLSDYDRATWQPAKLRTAVYWSSCRWPAIVGGSALAALGVIVLAIRRPERSTP